MTQPTQGEWKTDGLAIESDTFEICILSDEVKDEDGNGITQHELLANARLIAAAPKLLEALDVLMAKALKAANMFDNDHIDGNSSKALRLMLAISGVKSGYDLDVDKAHAAIAAAKGK